MPPGAPSCPPASAEACPGASAGSWVGSGAETGTGALIGCCRCRCLLHPAPVAYKAATVSCDPGRVARSQPHRHRRYPVSRAAARGEGRGVRLPPSAQAHEALTMFLVSWSLFSRLSRMNDSVSSSYRQRRGSHHQTLEAEGRPLAPRPGSRPPCPQSSPTCFSLSSISRRRADAS